MKKQFKTVSRETKRFANTVYGDYPMFYSIWGRIVLQMIWKVFFFNFFFSACFCSQWPPGTSRKPPGKSGQIPGKSGKLPGNPWIAVKLHSERERTSGEAAEKLPGKFGKILGKSGDFPEARGRPTPSLRLIEKIQSCLKFHSRLKFQPRLKISIPTFRIPHTKHRGMVGGSLEIFNLAWEF